MLWSTIALYVARGADFAAAPNGRVTYARGKAIVEPVFGQVMTFQDDRGLLLPVRAGRSASSMYALAIIVRRPSEDAEDSDRVEAVALADHVAVPDGDQRDEVVVAGPVGTDRTSAPRVFEDDDGSLSIPAPSSATAHRPSTRRGWPGTAITYSKTASPASSSETYSECDQAHEALLDSAEERIERR